jgi:hypothetical protein
VGIKGSLEVQTGLILSHRGPERVGSLQSVKGGARDQTELHMLRPSKGTADLGFEKPINRITWYSTKMVIMKEEFRGTIILRMEVLLNSASQHNHFIECYFFKEHSHRIDRLGLVDTLTYLHHVPVIQHCCCPITIL